MARTSSAQGFQQQLSPYKPMRIDVTNTTSGSNRLLVIGTAGWDTCTVASIACNGVNVYHETTNTASLVNTWNDNIGDGDISLQLFTVFERMLPNEVDGRIHTRIHFNRGPAGNELASAFRGVACIIAYNNADQEIGIRNRNGLTADTSAWVTNMSVTVPGEQSNIGDTEGLAFCVHNQNSDTTPVAPCNELVGPESGTGIRMTVMQRANLQGHGPITFTVDTAFPTRRIIVPFTVMQVRNRILTRSR